MSSNCPCYWKRDNGKTHFLLNYCGNLVVENLPHHFKIKDSSPAPTKGIRRKKNGNLDNGGNIVVEQ
jgi:hypothetical protein